MLLEAPFCKAARALLGWSANDLANESGISADTIRSFESGRTKNLNARNQEAILQAFHEAGISFLESGIQSPGEGLAIRDF